MALHPRLQKIRESKDLRLRPTAHLKQTFTGFDGKEHPLKIRYYQIQGILHLVVMKRFLLGDDTGLGKCAGYGTYVNTDLGLVKLGEIADWSGMEPDTFRPIGRDLKVLAGRHQAPIKNFYYGGVKPTIRVVTRYGFQNTMSLVHPMLVLRGDHHQWVQARDLREGDHLCVERRESPFPLTEPELTPSGPLGSMTPSLARFLGYYIGEGALTAEHQVRLSQSPVKNPETHADMLRLFQGLFGKLPDHPDQMDLYLNNTVLRRWLAANGIGYTLSANRVVPGCILQATRESSAEFLRALFEGEGHAGKAGIEYSTASEELGRQVQIMLLRFGVVSRRAPKKIKGRDHTYWRLTICGSDALTFQERLGFLSTRKKEALASCLDRPRNTNHDVVPGIRGVFEQVRKDLLQATSRTGSNSKRIGSGLKHLGVSLVNTLNNIRNYGRDPSYIFIERVVGLLEERNPGADSLPILKGFLETRYFYDPVVSLEHGKEEVFDIEVEDPSHSFVGNGLVNHNTLQTIAALCYVWESEPDQKAIVLTTKSATMQWAAEFSKFTTGVKVIVNKGTPKKREKARAEFQASTGPTVMVMGYGTVRRDYTHMQDWSDFTLVADECFQYHTPVTLADGSTELIGELVSRETPTEVLSWNPDTGVVEPREITKWHRNPLIRGKRKNLLHLKFRFGGKVRVTRTHKFYAPDGREVPATKLHKGSLVQHLSRDIPSEDQWQVILGGLLGDSGISGPKRSRWGISFGHSERQEEYLLFKRALLYPLGVSETGNNPNSGLPRKDGAPKEHLKFRLKANDAVTSFLVQAHVRRGGKKRVTVEWLNQINPLGLSVWYADDGSISTHTHADGTVSHRITLHTQGFSREEVETLAGWLQWRWGIRAEIETTKPHTDRENGHPRKSYSYLSLSKGPAQEFLDLLPCGFPGVEYKFPGKIIASIAAFDRDPKTGLVTDWVTEKKTWVPSDPRKNRYVYNLEVEGNHNYFANGSLVSNCTAFKNPKAQIHQVCRHLSMSASRMWGLTATLIKNNLMEGYGIYRVILPNGDINFTRMSSNAFMLYYCLTRMQRIPKSNRQIPVIVGYSPGKIREFKTEIEPYFLGRPKHDVASELPALISQVIEVGLSSYQQEKYDEALDGLESYGESTLLIGENRSDGEEEIKEVTKLTAITYFQEIVDHLGLIDCDGPSDKTDRLLELLTEGDLAGEKVIVFSRFRRMIDILMPLFKKAKIKAVRVTGDENQDQRSEAMASFQDPNSDTRVVCITMAGSDAINLQAAKAIVFYDTPWSAGDFIQIVGRMIRIGSQHDRCYAIHLVAKGKAKTVDHRIMEVMQQKMSLIEAVIGRRIKGMQDVGTYIPKSNDISDIFDLLREDAGVPGAPNK